MLLCVTLNEQVKRIKMEIKKHTNTAINTGLSVIEDTYKDLQVSDFPKKG